MKRIAFLVAHLHRYDAIASDIRGLSSFLLERGIESRVFADSCDPGVFVSSLRDLSHFIRDENDAVMFTYAGSWPNGESAFQNINAIKILRYHNVTPPEFFEPYDALTANMCRQGRDGLCVLLQKNNIRLFLSDSDYNSVDLLEAGASPDRIRRLSVFHQIDELLSYCDDPDPLILSLFSPDAPVILMVGRLVPNKGYANQILGFAAYKKKYAPDSHLVLAGSTYPSFSPYYREIEDLMIDQGVGGSVHLLSGLDARQLATLYQRANVFSICSEHEGFCVPIIEAMAFRTPIVALSNTAVTETLADVGISWPTFDTNVWAASLNHVMGNSSLRGDMMQKGIDRYNKEYTNDSVRVRFSQIFSNFFLQP